MNVRFAVLGTGGFADARLIPALSRTRGAQLWSVLSRDRGRAIEFAKKHNAASAAPAHDSLQALLADPELDAVIVATPDRLHADHTIAALRAGKHVLVEKPMATSAAEARSMVDAARASKVQLGVGYHLRWHNGHRLLSRSVHKGELGELRHIRVQWTYRTKDTSNWRASPTVGRWWALGAVGTHAVDMARWMMVPSCGEVVEVRSLCTSPVHNSAHEETALVMLRFASGATAEVIASVLFDSTSMVEIHGTDGSAMCEGTMGPHGGGVVRLRGDEIAFEKTDPYVGELTDFVSAIRFGREPEVTGSEGARNIEVLEAAMPAK